MLTFVTKILFKCNIMQQACNQSQGYLLGEIDGASEDALLWYQGYRFKPCFCERADAQVELTHGPSGINRPERVYEWS